MHWHVLRDLQMKATTAQRVIAEDYWSYRRGRKLTRSRVTVLQPEPIPKDKNGDWRCGVYVEGLMKKPTYAMGVGPVDSLMNASRLLISLWDEIGGATPRAAERPRRKVPATQRLSP